MVEKWVFEEIVEDDKDIIGLVAYALYKQRKHTLGVSLREQGKDEDLIREELKSFHNQALQSNSLDDYRARGKIFLDEIVHSIEEEFSKERRLLEEQTKKRLSAEKSKILKDIENYQRANQLWREKILNWFLSGLSTTFSSLLITCLIVGVLVLSVSTDRRQKILENIAADYFSVPQIQTQPTQSDTNHQP